MDIRRIFHPSTRLEDTNHHQVCMGPGLYAVRLIADLLGTTVTMDSVRGENTT
ncbi:MAG: ATP-binding protein [Actinomycetota bacterium]|nr:ATP-binding protein [Actinomycetota bacterium]